MPKAVPLIIRQRHRLHRAATLMVLGLLNFEDIRTALLSYFPLHLQESERRIAIPCSGWHVDADGNERAFTMKDEAMNRDCRKLEFEYKTIKSQRIVRWLPMRYALGIYLVCRLKSKVMKDFLPQGCFVVTFTDADPLQGRSIYRRSQLQLTGWEIAVKNVYL